MDKAMAEEASKLFEKLPGLDQKEILDYARYKLATNVSGYGFKQLKQVMLDRRQKYQASNGHIVYISDTIAFILDDAKRRKENAKGTTGDGSYYMSLEAEIEMLEKLLEGTVIHL
jgi:hypothetical protein